MYHICIRTTDLQLVSFLFFFFFFLTYSAVFNQAYRAHRVCSLDECKAYLNSLEQVSFSRDNSEKWKKKKKKERNRKAGYAILANPKEKRPSSPVSLLAKDGEMKKRVNITAR